MTVRINDLNFQAKCLLKTKIYLDHRSFSDFTIEELNEYAGFLYDLGMECHMAFTNFSLNRIAKTFGFIPTVETSRLRIPTGPNDLEKWTWYCSFLQYLFNVEGAEKFEYLAGVTKIRLSKQEKKRLSNFAKEFCDIIFYDLWSLFTKYPIVKEKLLEYFESVGILKKHTQGYAREA